MGVPLNAHVAPSDRFSAQPWCGSQETPRQSATWLQNFEIFKMKVQNTPKILKYQNTHKIVKNTKIHQNFAHFAQFPNFGAKVSRDFWGFEAFSPYFSSRSWKMLKNAALVVEIGVDTADILAF